MKIRIMSALIFSLAVLQGCITTPVQKVSDTMASRSQSLQLPVQSRPPEALPEKRDAFRELDHGKLYSLTFKDAELKDVLSLLSRDSSQPIVAEKDVEGKVTISLEGKKLGDVLFAVLKPLGYTVFVENGVIVVGRPKLVSKTFFINYIKDKRSSTSSMNASVSAGGGSSSSSTGTSSSSSSDSPGSGSSSGGSGGAVSVTTSGTSDFWDEIGKGLETIIFGSSGKSDKLGKKLVINKMAGVIYVTDSSDNIGYISSFLSDVEGALKRQVLIQAHIVEVGLTDRFSLGLDWKAILDKSTNFSISQSLAPTPNTNVFKIAAGGDNFSTLLDAMKEQGHVNMLSSPKISTMNNQRAVIKLTTREVTWVNSTIVNAQGNTLQTFTTPQVDEVGLFLDVTPNIDERGTITMQVHPSISELTRVSVSPDGKSSKPVIDVREVDTMVEVRTGQTAVIAGLIVDKLRESKRSVPILGELPYIGGAFSNISQEKTKTELVIFLTPYVLNEKTIEEIRREHEKRVMQLEESFQAINAMKPQIQGRSRNVAESLPVVAAPEPEPRPVPVPAAPAAVSNRRSEPPREASVSPVSAPVPVPVSVRPLVPKSPAPAAVSGDDGEKRLYQLAMSAYREAENCRQAMPLLDKFLSSYPLSLYASFVQSYRDDCMVRLSAR